MKNPIFSPRILGIAMAGALALSACGGGGGGAATTAGTSLSLTPVKGIYLDGSKCNVSVSNAAGTSFYNGTVTVASGVMNVNLPAGSTGPYVIAINDDGAGDCHYYNEATGASAVMTSPMHALVPTAAITAAGDKVTINAITEAAFQATSATGGGSISGVTDSDTDTRIQSGMSTALIQILGSTNSVSSINSVFQAPPVSQIPQSGVAPTSGVLGALYNLARTSKDDPMSAVLAAAKLAAANAASAAGQSAVANALKTEHDNIVNSASFVDASGNPGAAAFQALIDAHDAAAQSATVNATATQNFLSDGAAGQLGQLKPGFGGTPTIAHIFTATLSNALYTITQTIKVLVMGPTSPSWQTVTASSVAENYLLVNNSWVAGHDTGKNFSMNPDGTMHFYQDGQGTTDLIIGMMDMSGVPIASSIQDIADQINSKNSLGFMISPASVVQVVTSGVMSTVPSGVFTAGARSYTLTPVASAVLSQDMYELYSQLPENANFDWNLVYAPQTSLTSPAMAAGNAMTSMPTLNSASFCMNGYYMKPDVNGGGVYDAYSLWDSVSNRPLNTCVDTSQTANNGGLMNLMGTITLAADPNHSNVYVVTAVYVNTTITNNGLGNIKTNTILSVAPDGKLRIGKLTPKGSPVPEDLFGHLGNKTLGNELINALSNGLVPSL